MRINDELAGNLQLILGCKYRSKCIRLIKDLDNHELYFVLKDIWRALNPFYTENKNYDRLLYQFRVFEYPPIRYCTIEGGFSKREYTYEILSLRGIKYFLEYCHIDDKHIIKALNRFYNRYYSKEKK